MLRKYSVPGTLYSENPENYSGFSLIRKASSKRFLLRSADYRVRTTEYSTQTFILLLLLLTFLTVSTHAAPSPKPSQPQIKKGDLADKSKSLDMTPALQDYCRLLYGCNLKVPEGTCPAP